MPVLSIDNPRSKLLGSALDDDSANSLLCVRFPFNLHAVQYTLAVFANLILSGSIIRPFIPKSLSFYVLVFVCIRVFKDKFS